MSTRTLHWYESSTDYQAIKKNGWNFQIAKCVASGTAAPTYNVIWRSQGLAPKTTVSWNVQYALSWVSSVPSEGVTVAIEGPWQKCDKGQSFDIDVNGFWKPSEKPSDASDAAWLKVGNIDYTYPGVMGVHIVIGVQNSQTLEFEPVFIDESTLPRDSSARYQPQETVSWWLEASNLTGQVFHSTKSSSTTYDFTKPSNELAGEYEWSTSFKMIGGWSVIPGDPPQAAYAPPPSADIAALSLGGSTPIRVRLDFGHWLVVFATPLIGSVLAVVGTALYGKLKGTFKELKIAVVGNDGMTLSIDYKAGPAPNSELRYFGAVFGLGDGPQGIIDGALKDLQTAKAFPADETWDIKEAKASSKPKTVTRALAAPQTPEPSTGEERNRDRGYQLPVKAAFNQGFANGGYEQVGTVSVA
ncbi:hypothetical protein NKR19_g9211 [Coniochaeta hoffmannii]|uniref:Uncharacterized protein n=1 Tax=Coniochaeta hoffmannii TaxID=91930 RepID=A0AA38R430_9PEZI|nr:hypothetical protein NKR19_g9211 [Coniochaeta hoffmannii]